jgi:hypothetical protein
MALLLEVEQCEKRLDTGLLYYLPDIFKLIETNLKFKKHPEINEILQEFIKTYKSGLLSSQQLNSNRIKIHLLHNKVKRYLKDNYQKNSLVKLNKIKKNSKRLLEMLKKDNSLKLLIHQIFQQEYQKKFAIKSGKINLRDNRIKRIKLASLTYFIAEDEISFYGLHWDLQQYRRSRELGFTGYPLKPYP